MACWREDEIAGLRGVERVVIAKLPTHTGGPTMIVAQEQAFLKRSGNCRLWKRWSSRLWPTDNGSILWNASCSASC